MPNASDISGTVFVGGSSTNMARIIGVSGNAVTRADIATITYSLYSYNKYSGERTVVTNHDTVSLTVHDVIYDALQKDALWTVDTTGYNFRHELDVSTNAAFASTGNYLLEYRLQPISGQIIIVRFRLQAI